MAKTVLVGPDIELGERALKILDDAVLAVKVALWFYAPEEYSDWRLILASRRFDAVRLTDAYGLVHDALEAAGITFDETPSLMIMEMSDLFIKALRRQFAKAANVHGMHIVSQVYGDRYIQDGYVYRIS